MNLHSLGFVFREFWLYIKTYFEPHLQQQMWTICELSPAVQGLTPSVQELGSYPQQVTTGLTTLEWNIMIVFKGCWIPMVYRKIAPAQKLDALVHIGLCCELVWQTWLGQILNEHYLGFLTPRSGSSLKVDVDDEVIWYIPLACAVQSS